jgi:hypothetical protein
MVARNLTFTIKVREEHWDELKGYLEMLSAEDILFGLKFSYNRKTAEEGGYLLPGRKSFIIAETKGLNATQALWRLQHWKSMIKNYREKGYSYPTISRIKKKVKMIADGNQS